MKERKIYLGNFNNENKKYLKSMAFSYLKENKGDKFYYILPNSLLLKKYRREFIEDINSLFELNLYTFDDVVNKIIEGDFRKTVNDPMKRLIIRKVLKKLAKRNQLEYYSDLIEMEGFIESCIEIIREIKRSLISPEVYFKRCPQEKMYLEVGKIYQEYELELGFNMLTDRENDYLSCIKLMETSDFYMNNLDFVIIDEFYDFRPVEMEIIRALSMMDLDIYINMPFGLESNNKILKNTLEVLKDMGFEIVIVEKKDKNIFESLGERLFSSSEEKFNYIEEIQIIKSPSRYLELKKIFREIKRYLIQGISLQDMGLVVLSNSYLNSLSRVSLEEDIPLTSGNSTQLIMIPMIREFLNLINTRISPTRLNILNRVKSTYFPICNEENKNEIEYGLRHLNFKDLDQIIEVINGNQSIGISQDLLSNLINLIDTLKEEHISIPSEGNLRDYNRYFLKLINDYHIDRWIVESFQGDEYIFNRDLSSLEKLNTLLHKMDEIGLIQEKISIEDYFLVLEDYLSSENIIESDFNLNGLQVLSPINTRGLSFKKLFIVGLSQEEYPNLNNNSFFLKDDNYNDLKKIGIDFKDYYERFSNEALKFKTIIASCRESLFMSFNENSLEEGKNIPSMFIDEVLSRIKGDEIKEKVKTSNLDVDFIINSDIKDSSCEKDLINSLLYKYFKGELDEKYLKIYEGKYPGKLKKINSIAEVALMRSLSEYNSYRGKLGDNIVKDIIKGDLKNKVYSISYLEGYVKCPYYFLLNKFFNIEEMSRETESYSPLDIGSVYHQVLYHYYRKYKDSMENIDDFNVYETLDYLQSLVYKYAQNQGYRKEDDKDLLIIENINIKLKNLVILDIGRLKENQIIPWGLEVEFGKNEDFEIEYNGKKIKIRGIIDRIDKLPGGKFMVLDYKSSSYGKQDISRIEDGLSLQLPVYIMSQDLDIVAASYITISDGEFFVSMGILGEADFINKRQKGAVDRLKWDEVLTNTKSQIIQIIESILDGDFSVNPKDCSQYCPYKDICRYEKLVEVE